MYPSTYIYTHNALPHQHLYTTVQNVVWTYLIKVKLQMAAFVSLKNANAIADAYSIFSASNFGGPLSYIKLCLKTATLLQDYITALRGVVSDKEKEDMLQNVKLLQMNLQKIKDLQSQHNLSEQEAKGLYAQLEQAKDQLEDLSEHAKKNWMKKLWHHVWSTTSMKDKLKSIEAKVNLVVQKSTLLVTTLNLELTASLEKEMSLKQKNVLLELQKMKSEVVALKNKMISEHNTLILKLNAVILLKHDGIWPVMDKSIPPPDPPNILHIKETNGKLFVRWHTQWQCNKIDFFVLCYDEEEKLNLIFSGNVSEATIGSPEVELIPEKHYTMKVCGVNPGGRGEWSNSVVQQFTKPYPGKPDPPKIFSVSSSTAKFTLTPPKQACPTESPITKWKIECAMPADTNKWMLMDKFTLENVGEKLSFNVELITKKKYHFRVKAKNAEGWGDYSKAVSFEMWTYSYVDSLRAHFQVVIIIIIIIIALYLFLCTCFVK